MLLFTGVYHTINISIISCISIYIESTTDHNELIIKWISNLLILYKVKYITSTVFIGWGLWGCSGMLSASPPPPPGSVAIIPESAVCGG